MGSNDVKSQAFLAKTVETGEKSATACVFALLERMYALYVHLTYKDDDLFRNGSFHEW